MKVKFGEYLTPSTVRIFIDDVWIEDALRIEYRVQDPVIPMYNYWNRRVHSFAHSHALVSGSLVLNFRTPGYLFDAVRKGAKKASEDEMWIGAISSFSNLSLEERIEYIDQLRQEGKQESIDKLIAQSDGINPLFSSGVLSGPTDNIEKVRVTINWADANLDTENDIVLSTDLENVFFTGYTNTANAAVSETAMDVSTSGRPLYEIYSFIASHVIDKKVKHPRVS